MKIIIHAHASYSRKVTDIAATDEAPSREDIGIHVDRSGVHTRQLSSGPLFCTEYQQYLVLFRFLISLYMLDNFAGSHDVA